MNLRQNGSKRLQVLESSTGPLGYKRVGFHPLGSTRGSCVFADWLERHQLRFELPLNYFFFLQMLNKTLLVEKNFRSFTFVLNKKHSPPHCFFFHSATKQKNSAMHTTLNPALHADGHSHFSISTLLRSLYLSLFVQSTAQKLLILENSIIFLNYCCHLRPLHSLKAGEPG